MSGTVHGSYLSVLGCAFGLGVIGGIVRVCVYVYTDRTVWLPFFLLKNCVQVYMD